MKTAEQARSHVIRGLSHGFGSEDIAVIYGVPVNIVRAVIRRLRAEGRLTRILHTARDRWERGLEG